jgi:hypothetical protein
MFKKFVWPLLVVFLLGMLWMGENPAQASESDQGAAAVNCAKIKLSLPTAGLTGGKPRINFNISNQGSTTYIKGVSFDWKAYQALNSKQKLQRWSYDGAVIYGAATGNAAPYAWKKPNTDLLQGETDTFNFDFALVDANWPGNIPAAKFDLKVVLGNGCTVSVHPILTPTPTLRCTDC